MLALQGRRANSPVLLVLLALLPYSAPAVAEAHVGEATASHFDFFEALHALTMQEQWYAGADAAASPARPQGEAAGGAEYPAAALLRLQYLFENENFLNALIAYEDTVLHASILNAPESAPGGSGMAQELALLVSDPCVWRILEMAGVPLNNTQQSSREVCAMQWPAERSSGSQIAELAQAMAPQASHRERSGTPMHPPGRDREWLLPRRRMLAKILKVKGDEIRARPVRFRAYLGEHEAEDDAEYVYDMDGGEGGNSGSDFSDEEEGGVDYADQIRKLDAEIKAAQCKVNGGEDCDVLPEGAISDEEETKTWEEQAAWLDKHYPYISGQTYDRDTDPVLMQGKIKITKLSDQPRVYTVANFATDEEMDTLMEVGNAWRGGGKHDSTGKSFEMPIDRVAVGYRVYRRMQALLGMNNDMGSTLRTRRYGPGESHPPHVDWFEITRDDGSKSNLIATAMLNMVSTAKGGATEFLDAVPKALKVRPKRGTLVLWWSCTATGVKDTNSLHQGNVVKSGEKFTVTQFFYQPLSACGAENMYGEVEQQQ